MCVHVYACLCVHVCKILCVSVLHSVRMYFSVCALVIIVILYVFIDPTLQYFHSKVITT